MSTSGGVSPVSEDGSQSPVQKGLKVAVVEDGQMLLTIEPLLCVAYKGSDSPPFLATGSALHSSLSQ